MITDQQLYAITRSLRGVSEHMHRRANRKGKRNRKAQLCALSRSGGRGGGGSGGSGGVSLRNRIALHRTLAEDPR